MMMKIKETLTDPPGLVIGPCVCGRAVTPDLAPGPYQTLKDQSERRASRHSAWTSLMESPEAAPHFPGTEGEVFGRMKRDQTKSQRESL